MRPKTQCITSLPSVGWAIFFGIDRAALFVGFTPLREVADKTVLAFPDDNPGIRLAVVTEDGIVVALQGDHPLAAEALIVDLDLTDDLADELRELADVDDPVAESGAQKDHRRDG